MPAIIAKCSDNKHVDKFTKVEPYLSGLASFDPSRMRGFVHLPDLADLSDKSMFGLGFVTRSVRDSETTLK